jgi:hypothetical protein
MARGSRALALLFVLPLAGCAVPAAWGMTAGDARTHLVRAVDETEALTGGSWQSSDDTVPRECVIPPWTAGERSSALRIGTPPIDPQEAADTVDAAWRSWGYEVTRAAIDSVAEVQGRFGGELLIFRASEFAMSLQGESECSPTR